MRADRDTIVNAIKAGDVAALCAAVWDSAEVWAYPQSELKCKIVEEWHLAEKADAVNEFSPRDAWERVGGKPDVEATPDEVDEIIADAIDACWWAMVESALDRLGEEKKKVEDELDQVERMIYLLEH